MNKYRLLSTIISEDEIQINVLHNGEHILNKFIHMELNGDKTPTFANSRMKYNEDELNLFIQNISNNEQYMFPFEYVDIEDENIFDGFFYHNGSHDIAETLIIKVVDGKLNMSTHIMLKDCKNEIIGDLYSLRDNIKELYDNKLKYINIVYDEVEEEEEETV